MRRVEHGHVLRVVSRLIGQLVLAFVLAVVPMADSKPVFEITMDPSFTDNIFVQGVIRCGNEFYNEPRS
jgi:hypothetical protein